MILPRLAVEPCRETPAEVSGSFSDLFGDLGSSLTDDLADERRLLEDLGAVDSILLMEKALFA